MAPRAGAVSGQAGSSETARGRIEPLAGDVEFELFRQPDRHVVKYLSGEFVNAKVFLVTLNGARRHFNAGLQVEGVLDVATEDVSLGGLLGGPTEEVGQEDQAGHRVQFLGGDPQFPAEMLSQFAHRHQLEEEVSNDSLGWRALSRRRSARTLRWVPRVMP
jgi:hypothetical protein